MTSQLPSFRCLFISRQQQKKIENGAAVTSFRSFLFRDNFSNKTEKPLSPTLLEQKGTHPCYGHPLILWHPNPRHGKTQVERL